MKKIITLLVMIFVAMVYGQNYNVELIKETYFGNDYNDAKVVDTLAYLATDGKLLIYSVSDKSKPKILKNFSYNFNLQKIEIRGNYAYVAAGSKGVKIFDLSNKLNPVLVNTVETLDSTISVKFSGDLMFTAEFTQGFKIFNVTDPINPVLLRQILSGNLVIGVTIKQPNIAYVTLPDQNISIVDFSNPFTADTVGRIPLLGFSLYFDTAIKDNFLYVLDYFNGIHIYSITNPIQPQYQNTISSTTNGTTLNLFGNALYASKRTFTLSKLKLLPKTMNLTAQGVDIYDITNPVSPLLKSSINVQEPNNCYQLENYLYLSSNYSFKVFNISGSVPVITDSVENVGQINFSLVDGNYLYVGTSKSGLIVLNITNPENPIYVTRYLSGGAVYGMTKQNNYLYLTCEGSIHIVNISTPSNLVYVSGYNYLGQNYNPRRVAMPNDSIAYVVGGDLPGVSALKTKPIDNIWETDRYGYGILPYASFSDVVCKDTLIYTVNNYNAFYILSLTPSGQFRPWYIIGEGGFAGICLNNKIYIAAGTTGLKTLDVTNPLLPMLMSTFPTNGDARSVKAIGDIAYVSNGTGGIDIVNVANPSAPYRIGRYDTDGNASHLDVKGSYIYLADKTALGIYRFTFNLPPSVEVLSPNGGENYPVGSVRNITWTTTNVNSVKLEYTTNNGTSWTLIASTLPSSPTSYSWTVPNTPSTQCRVRISDAVNPAVFDISNNTFSISAPASLTLISPNGGESWMVGSTQSISWSAENVGSVKLEYSTNNGTDWLLIISPISLNSTYNWTVPNTPSTTCKVKVSDVNNPELYDVSNNIFNIYRMDLSWSASIAVKDAGTNFDTLVFGQAPTATNGLDLSLGEIELPPVPPSGVFDLRFNLPIAPVVSSKKDFRNDSETQINWIIQFQPSAAGYPFTFTWNPNLLPAGNFFLKDLITGTIINVNMKIDSTFVLTSNGITQLRIEYTNLLCKSITVNQNWNILSVPLIANNMLMSSLFPTKTSSAFGYSNGYTQLDSAKNGQGFWVKFDSLHNISICGSAVTSNAIPVSTGWNLVGPYDRNVPVSAITSNPAGIISTLFFGYSNGYISADSLKYGKGYWVKVSQNGTLILPSLENKINLAKNSVPFKTEWTKIIITDNRGTTNTLYLADDNTNLNNFELPPVPPVGIADIRFNSNRLVEKLDVAKTITLNSLTYPVRIYVEGKDLNIKDNVNGSLFNSIIKKGESISLNNPAVNSISVSQVEIPNQFSLMQNYPNPFNPTTIIKFGLAEKAKTSLKIYNQIGQVVQELVNKEFEAGYHQVTFDATNFASGIYFYEINAGNFRQIKKMILIK